MRFKNIASFRKSMNSVLPDDIYVCKMKIVNDDFHARYSSKGKGYEYRVITNESPTRRRFAWIVPDHYHLDINKMRKAAKLFIGQKDYKEFCKIKDKSGIVLMKSIKISQYKDEIYIRIEANRFLYKMVRRIIGALVEIGRGHRTEDDIKRALTGGKHRSLICAPANGLALVKVIY
jgi:tRNA pseudouridine38-40 synthase